MQYETMATEELQARLRADAKKPVGEGMPYEEVKSILDVLVSRDPIPEARVKKAWDDFLKYYLPSSQK